MFSVIIPLYNKRSTIRGTIESVLNQSYQSFEIIVVDDGSTDGSAEIVESINDPRIRVISQSNQGVSAARNTGIKTAKHNWLALLDGDDKWDFDYLRTILFAIQDDPDCIAYCAGYRRVDMQGRVSRISWKSIPANGGRLSNYFRSSFFSSPVMTSSSVCLNKSVLRRKDLESPFPEGVKSGEDLDAWVRIALNGNIYVINTISVTINVVQVGATHLADRLSGEFDYKKWFWYECDSPAKRFWLIIYSLKKLYKVLKKDVLVSNLWLHRFYVNLIKR